VVGTGHHVAVHAQVAPGKIAAVIGDGAVGLCGVIAAKRLGAEQIIIPGRHTDHTGRLGAHSMLECGGLSASMETAIGIARRVGAIGRVGVPQDDQLPGSRPAFYASLTIGGGPAPARAYIEELLPDILEGRIQPGRVLDRTVDLEGVPGRTSGDGSTSSLWRRSRPTLTAFPRAEIEPRSTGPGRTAFTSRRATTPPSPGLKAPRPRQEVTSWLARHRETDAAGLVSPQHRGVLGVGDLALGRPDHAGAILV
jgi:hypothetical protein